MIAAYAMGGGLGHVARVREVLTALGEEPSRCAILTASPLAEGPDIVRVPRRLSASATAFGAWLRDTLRAIAPSAMIVDAFPLGILGELADHSVLPEVPAYHVARLLKWNTYHAAFPGTPRRYDASLCVEPLTSAHEKFLREHSGEVRSLELPPQRRRLSEDPFGEFPRPVWLVVHSGPATEVHVLLEFAAGHARREQVTPHFVVVSPRAQDLPAGITGIAHSRASELFPYASRIVTGCGFNSMLEARQWRSKHLYLPFERRFDDQSRRAFRATAESAPFRQKYQIENTN